MRIVALYLVCLWSSLVCPTFEMDQPHRQKRQLDWNSGGRIYHFDHLALSSDINPEHRASGEESSSSSEEDPDPVHSTALSKSGLPGDPGIDYPILPSIPLTDFHCRGRAPGFYGDTQTACQVFHVCDISGRQDSFLCPNGTIFSQKLFACDWWYNVQCSATREHYQLNRNLFKGGDVNLYGTPSFWNWLSESEEVHSNAPSPKDNGRSHQKATIPPNKYIETPSPSPRGPSVQHHEFTEPTAPQLEIEQLPEPAPLVQSQPAEQLSEPVVDSAELEPIGPPKVESGRPSQWESFLPAPPPLQKVAATLAPPLSDDEIASQGFTRDYQNHYFNWMNQAIHPNSDMAPELSWSDLGPNGPLMTGHRSQVADEQSTGQQSPAADRRRKAKPAAVQHTRKPVAVKKQTLARQAAVLTPPTQPPAYVSKAASFKKQITPHSKQVTTLPPVKSTFKPASKSGVSKASLSQKSTPNSTPKHKINKTKPKERSSTVTETFDRPMAKNDHFNEYEDVVHYDDSSNKPTNQRIREAIARQTSRFGGKLKMVGKTHQTEHQETTYHTIREKKFVPSPKVMPIVPSPQIMPNRADGFANPFTWVASSSQPASLYRTEPFWGHSPAQNLAYYKPPTSPLPVSRAQPTSAANWSIGPSVRNTKRWSSESPEVYRSSEARSLDQSVPSSESTLALERIQPAFRPSQPIPAITSNSHQPRVRTLRAHPSPKARSAGVKRKRKSKSKAITAYDPRLDRPYGQNHPIWKLQNWESTKI